MGRHPPSERIPANLYGWFMATRKAMVPPASNPARKTRRGWILKRRKADYESKMRCSACGRSRQSWDHPKDSG